MIPYPVLHGREKQGMGSKNTNRLTKETIKEAMKRKAPPSDIGRRGSYFVFIMKN